MILKLSLSASNNIVVNKSIMKEYIHYCYHIGDRLNPLAYKSPPQWITECEALAYYSGICQEIEKDYILAMGDMCLKAIRGTWEPSFSEGYSKRPLDQKNVSTALLKHFKLKEKSYTLAYIAGAANIGIARLKYWLKSRGFIDYKGAASEKVSWMFILKDGKLDSCTRKAACYLITLLKAYKLRPWELYTI